MDFLISFYENKLLFYGLIAVIFFVVISIILIKKTSKEEKEEIVDIEKIDGNKSVFDEIIEEKEASHRDQLDLDSMIAKMQQDIDAKASEVVEKFENEQEEKSVISYTELMKNKNDVKLDISKVDVDASIALEHLNDLDEIKQVKVENDSLLDDVVTIDPINDIVSDIKTEIEKPQMVSENIIPSVEVPKEELVENINENVISKLNMKNDFIDALKTGNYEDDKMEQKNKFKSTEFISPIYGVQNITMQYPTVQNMKEFKSASVNNYNKFELEQTLNMEKLSDEVRKDEDFLKALKEFRKNLE